MLIDWKSMEVHPDRAVKIMAQVLLDFRQKVMQDDALIKDLRAENERLRAENDKLKGTSLVHEETG